MPVVELDTIRASDANMRYGDFTEIPLYVAVFSRFFPQKTQSQKNLHPNLHPAVSIGGVVDHNSI